MNDIFGIKSKLKRLTVEIGNVAVRISEDRVADGSVLSLLNVLHPFVVVTHAVDAQSNRLKVKRIGLAPELLRF
jgi:hypothetical protein